MAAPALATPPVWIGYAGNPQHTALSSVASQPLSGIIWQTPVDLVPQYSGSLLYIHYGSSMVSGANTVLVPVKTSATGDFRVEARLGENGGQIWQLATDYILPTNSWTPVFGPTLTSAGRLYMPATGGTLLYTDAVDDPVPHGSTRIAFYGTSNFNSNPGGYSSDVKICTPLTSDASGNVYFGYHASGVNPSGLTDGIARVAPDGTVSYVSASAASSGSALSMAMNCAPAISNDGTKVYVVINVSSSNSAAYLVSLNAATLAPLAKVQLIDPHSLTTARAFRSPRRRRSSARMDACTLACSRTRTSRIAAGRCNSTRISTRPAFPADLGGTTRRRSYRRAWFHPTRAPRATC